MERIEGDDQIIMNTSHQDINHNDIKSKSADPGLTSGYHNASDRWILFLLGAGVGLILYLTLYGVRRLGFTDISWIYDMQGDIRQHYTGWVFFRNGDWQFPLGMTDQMMYPYNTSVLFSDSIPLLAIFFKLFRGILPETFQYLGAYGLLCFLLQGGFGALIAGRFHPSKVVCALFSIVFVFSPILLYRMYSHTSLSSHYLLLFAIYLWLSAAEIRYRRSVLLWALLGILCAGIHIYFLPMVGLILIAFCVKAAIHRNHSVLQAISLIPVYCISAALMVYAEGGFTGAGDLSDFGLGIYNANLNVLINGYGIDLLLPNLPFLPGQYEGYGPLGAGVLLLLILSLIFGLYHLISKGRSRTKEQDRNKPVVDSSDNKNTPRSPLPDIIIGAVLILVSILLAMSINISLNDRLLATIPLPQLLYQLLGIFRCSGRFIWIPVYVLTGTALMLLLTRCKKPLILVVLVICSAVQIYDLSSYYGHRRLPDIEQPFQSEVWEYLAEHYSHIQYIGYPDTETLVQLGWYAAKNHISVSQSIISRSDTALIQQGIEDSVAELRNLTPDPDTIYVFNNELYYPEFSLHLYDSDSVVFGVTEELSMLSAIPNAPLEIRYHDGLGLIGGEDTADGRIVHNDGTSFGPYYPLQAYTYEIIVTGQNLSAAEYDVFSGDHGTTIPCTLLESTDTELRYYYTLTEDYSDLEFRFFNHSGEDIVIEHLYIMTDPEDAPK